MAVAMASPRSAGGNTDFAGALDQSTTNITGGCARDASSNGVTTVNISGGQIDISHSNGVDAVVNANGGTVGTNDPWGVSMVAYGGTIDVNGGSVTMNAGTIRGTAIVPDSGLLDVLGGDGRAAAYDSATVDIRGGHVGYLDVSGDATATISGRTVTGSSTGSPFGFGQGHITLVGSDVSGNFWLFEGSRLEVFGLGFDIDVLGTEDEFGAYARHALSGSLLDGRSIDGVGFTIFQMAATTSGHPATVAAVVQSARAGVPEIDPALVPSALALVGAGLVLLERCTRGAAQPRTLAGC